MRTPFPQFWLSASRDAAWRRLSFSVHTRRRSFAAPGSSATSDGELPTEFSGPPIQGVQEKGVYVSRASEPSLPAPMTTSELPTEAAVGALKPGGAPPSSVNSASVVASSQPWEL